MSTTQKQPISIYTESSPNPNSMKFMLSFLLIDGPISFDFPDKESTANSPLAEAIFGFDYVTRVFFMNNFVTVTQDGSKDWMEEVPALRDFLYAYFQEEKPVFSETQKDVVVEANDDTLVVQKIKSVLEEYIKPAVEMDGGAIQLHSFDEATGIVKVELQGSCSGCPSSTVTLKAGIESLMKRMVPEVTEVVAEGV